MSKRIPVYIKRFVVRGKGSFPLDMLRYDGCYPSSGNDVDNISIQPRDLEDYKLPRNVDLTGFTHGNPDFYPNRARWASFGWEVISVFEVSV